MSISFIGSTLGLVASTPATEDESGYGALTTVVVGKVVSISELGDTSEDITWTLLAEGRVNHLNGGKDLGNISVVVEYDRSDAGLALLEAGNNTNTNHSFLITDTDGDKYYFQGIIADLITSARDASTYKGMTFTMRGNTAITKVDGP